MTAIIDFHGYETGDVESPHPNGYTHWDIVRNWTDIQWEVRHDFIQWIFPLKEASSFSPNAPLLTDEDIALFRSNKFLSNQCFQSFHRFMRFLGLRCTLTDGPLVPRSPSLDWSSEGWSGNRWVTKPMVVNDNRMEFESPDFAEEFLTPARFEQKQKIWQSPNHNWLRITRCLHSLRILGLEFAAESFFNALCNLYNANRGITTDTFRYWQEAAQGGLG